jgi:hypothetical protein
MIRLPLGRDAKNGDDACVDFIMERPSTYIRRELQIIIIQKIFQKNIVSRYSCLTRYVNKDQGKSSFTSGYKSKLASIKATLV